MMLPPASATELRAKYRSLVWSNPDGASDEVYILAALRRGSFPELLDFACVFGLDRLRAGWTSFQSAEPAVAQTIRLAVERILCNLQTAANHGAQTRHPERVGTVTP